MLEKVFYTIFGIVILFTNDGFASAHKGEILDPETIRTRPVQTQNGKGMNCNDLGQFDESFLRDCRALEVADDSTEGKVLFIGAAYGRFPFRVLKETSGSHLVVNELSPDNLQSLVSKVIAMKSSGDPEKVVSADRVSFAPGDCFDIPHSIQFLRILMKDNTDNAFDLIMCANVMHFFDGTQVLEFLLNTFNMLKPGGKAHIFTHSRLEDLTLEELSRRRRTSNIYMKAIASIVIAAQKEGGFLFPGLIHSQWLNKTEALKYVLKNSPNGMGLANYIPSTTFHILAHKIGFTVTSEAYYTLMLKNDSAVMVEDPATGQHYGLVLQKPIGPDQEPLTLKSLDADLVKCCVGATEKMKKFIEAKLEFPEHYPFVKEK